MKRTARICIILLLVLLLAGCTGGNRTEQPEATAAESVQETAAPETPTDEPEEEPAAEAAEEAAEPEPTEIPEIQGDPTFEGLETEDEVTVDLGETQDVGGL